MQGIHEDFTGYVAKTTSGRSLVEPESPGDTGWSRLPFNSIHSIEFWWKGRKKAELSVPSLPRGCTPFYCHTAAIISGDFTKRALLSRSLGYVTEEGVKVLTVFDEHTGSARSYIGS